MYNSEILTSETSETLLNYRKVQLWMDGENYYNGFCMALLL